MKYRRIKTSFYKVFPEKLANRFFDYFPKRFTENNDRQSGITNNFGTLLPVVVYAHSGRCR